MVSAFVVTKNGAVLSDIKFIVIRFFSAQLQV